MSATAGWDVRPGDWVEVKGGLRGTVLETCSVYPGGQPFAVNVGFEWVEVNDLLSWTPLE